MKRYITMPLILLLVASLLAGCGLLTGRDWQAQYDAGMQHLDAGAYQDAVIAFSVAIQIDEKQQEAYLARAFAYGRMENYSAAWADYQQAQSLAPKDDTVQKAIDSYRAYMESMGLREDGTLIAPAQTQPPVESLPPVTEPPVILPAPQPAEPETPPTAPPTEPPAPPSGQLVSDALCRLCDEDGYIICFHIPRIYIDGSKETQLNQQIYRQYNDMVQREVFDAVAGGVSPGLGGMNYGWGRSGDLLSIVVQIYAPWEGWSFDVYNINLTTGRTVSDTELLTAYGMSRDDFRAAAKNALQLYWDARRELRDEMGAEFFDTMVANTLSDSNLNSIVPYITDSGELGVIANVFSPAGATSYLYRIDLDTGSAEDNLMCHTSHTS